MIALSWLEILEVGLLVGTFEGQRVRRSREVERCVLLSIEYILA